MLDLSGYRWHLPFRLGEPHRLECRGGDRMEGNKNRNPFHHHCHQRWRKLIPSQFLGRELIFIFIRGGRNHQHGNPQQINLDSLHSMRGCPSICMELNIFLRQPIGPHRPQVLVNVGDHRFIRHRLMDTIQWHRFNLHQQQHDVREHSQPAEGDLPHFEEKDEGTRHLRDIPQRLTEVPQHQDRTDIPPAQ